MFVCLLETARRDLESAEGFIAKQLSDGAAELTERTATFARKCAGRALSKGKAEAGEKRVWIPMPQG